MARVDYRGKRLLDVVVSLVGIVLTLPIQVAAAIAIRVSSPGPALHRALRVGRSGERFTLYKFRSMRVGATSIGPAITAAGDSRVTPVGRVLRRTKIDELPQLYNVLTGDMSIVGPRPEAPQYVDRYTVEQRRILDWRPGLTSPASITYRHEEAMLAAAPDLDRAYEQIATEKLALDIAALDRSTWLTDVRVIARTIRAIAGQHAPAEPGSGHAPSA